MNNKTDKSTYTAFNIGFCNKKLRADCLFDETDSFLLEYLEHQYFPSFYASYHHLIETLDFRIYDKKPVGYLDKIVHEQ